MNWPDILHHIDIPAAGARRRFAALDLPVERLRAEVPAPRADEPYGRKTLYSGPEGEVVLLGWRAGGDSAPHDHGGAGGFALLLAGSFRETFWRFDGATLTASPERRIAAPRIIPVSAHAIHSMGALDDGVSLHLYTAATEPMRVYDPERRRTLTVADECGAWVPRNDGLIVSAEGWA